MLTGLFDREEDALSVAGRLHVEGLPAGESAVSLTVHSSQVEFLDREVLLDASLATLERVVLANHLPHQIRGHSV